jgi:hypothetical protein
MNITIRFNELIENFDPGLTIITDHKFETEKYILYETHIDHNIYSPNHESYDKIVIHNKKTNDNSIYYLDGINDLDIYSMLYFQLSDLNNDPKHGIKRKADVMNDLEHSFKRLKLDGTNKQDEIIEEIQKSLKRKRMDDNGEEKTGYLTDDEDEPINKKQKT